MLVMYASGLASATPPNLRNEEIKCNDVYIDIMYRDFSSLTSNRDGYHILGVRSLRRQGWTDCHFASEHP